MTGPASWGLMCHQQGETSCRHGVGKSFSSNTTVRTNRLGEVKSMALVRCIMEMGMGVDVHGRDYTNAAKRAVFDAIHHSSLGFQRLLGKTADDMRVDITIGSPQPDQVDGDAVVATLPHGTGYCKVVLGGLEIPNEDGTDAMVIANAAVIVSFDDGL